MAININYEPEKEILIITVKDQCTLEDYEAAMDEIIDSKQYPANVNALWDVREQDFSNVDSSIVQNLIILNKRYPDRATAKKAFIVNRNLAFGMLRMYEMYSSIKESNTPQYLKVFRSYAEGEKWLLDEELIYSNLSFIPEEDT